MVGWPNATFSTTLAVLRPTPGMRSQRGAILRHLAAMLVDQHARQGDHVLGLGIEEADGLDVPPFPSPSSPSASILLRGCPPPRKALRRSVDPRHRRLRRQDHGDQQGERVAVVELALRGRVGLGQAAEEFLRCRQASSAEGSARAEGAASAFRTATPRPQDRTPSRTGPRRLGTAPFTGPRGGYIQA